jgi:hypothetical protein
MDGRMEEPTEHFWPIFANRCIAHLTLLFPIFPLSIPFGFQFFLSAHFVTELPCK